MSLDYDVVVVHSSCIMYKGITDTPSFRSKWSAKFIKNFTVLFKIRTARENNLLNIYII